MSSLRAVFVDRDGTLNTEIEYLHRVEEFEWIPGTVDAIRRLNEAGVLVLVITNQAGVAHGYYSEDDVHRIHRHMQNELEAEGARIDAFYYCPYHPDGTVAKYRRPSRCRKPETGMLERGLAEWKIEPEQCVVIGDRNTDVETGRRMGMKTILVRTGYGAGETASTSADHVVPDIASAVDLLLEVAEI